MSNLIYDNDFYNKEVKERYLSHFDKPSQDTTGRIFKRSYYSEEQEGKDLYDFNRDELKRLLMSLSPKNSSASRVNASLISSYINWSIDEGYRENTLNPLLGIDLDWHEQFVDKSKKTLYTDQEIYEVVGKLVNGQDSVIPLLLFEGATVDELINITKHDIDQDNNKVILKNDEGRERTLYVTDICMTHIKRALNDNEYTKRNGDVSDSIKAAKLPLHDNDYLIRNSVARGATNGKVDYHTVKRRMTVIGELNDYPAFNPSNVRDSGMLRMAKNILQPGESLSKHHYEEIMERFGSNKTIVNGESVYNYYGFKRRFLNDEKLAELYGE